MIDRMLILQLMSEEPFVNHGDIQSITIARVAPSSSLQRWISSPEWRTIPPGRRQNPIHGEIVVDGEEETKPGLHFLLEKEVNT
jgi:hypothetical protein